MLSTLLIFLWLIFIAYWLLSARGNKKASYQKSSVMGGVFARIVLIAAFILLWTLPLFSLKILSSNTAVETAGVLLCLSGLAFSIWARRTLGTNWSANPIEIKKGHELVTTGPYRWVRHPIYSGVILALLGTFLADGRLRASLFFIMVVVGMFIRSRMEDGLMTQNFPVEYPEYKKKTKALIPGIF